MHDGVPSWREWYHARTVFGRRGDVAIVHRAKTYALLLPIADGPVAAVFMDNPYAILFTSTADAMDPC